MPRRGLSSPCLDNQKKSNTFVLHLQKPKMKNKRNNKKKGPPTSPQNKKEEGLSLTTIPHSLHSIGTLMNKHLHY
jgi:hypothetical protein